MSCCARICDLSAVLSSDGEIIRARADLPTVFDNYNTAIMVDDEPYNLGLWVCAVCESVRRSCI
jgi:hypothetical protein